MSMDHVDEVSSLVLAWSSLAFMRGCMSLRRLPSLPEQTFDARMKEIIRDDLAASHTHDLQRDDLVHPLPRREYPNVVWCEYRYHSTISADHSIPSPRWTASSSRNDRSTVDWFRESSPRDVGSRRSEWHSNTFLVWSDWWSWSSAIVIVLVRSHTYSSRHGSNLKREWCLRRSLEQTSLTLEIVLIGQPEFDDLFHFFLFLIDCFDDVLPTLFQTGESVLINDELLFDQMFAFADQLNQFLLSLIEIIDRGREIRVDFDQTVIVGAKVPVDDRQVLFDRLNVIVPLLTTLVEVQSIVLTHLQLFETSFDHFFGMGIFHHHFMKMFRSFEVQKKLIGVQAFDQILFRLEESGELLQLFDIRAFVVFVHLLRFQCLLNVIDRLHQFIQILQVDLLSMFQFSAIDLQLIVVVAQFGVLISDHRVLSIDLLARDRRKMTAEFLSVFVQSTDLNVQLLKTLLKVLRRKQERYSWCEQCTIIPELCPSGLRYRSWICRVGSCTIGSPIHLADRGDERRSCWTVANARRSHALAEWFLASAVRRWTIAVGSDG